MKDTRKISDMNWVKDSDQVLGFYCGFLVYNMRPSILKIFYPRRLYRRIDTWIP